MSDTSNTTISLPTSQPKEKMKARDVVRQQLGGMVGELDDQIGGMEATSPDQTPKETFSTDGFMSLDQMFGGVSNPPRIDRSPFEITSSAPSGQPEKPKAIFEASGSVVFNSREEFDKKQVIEKIESFSSKMEFNTDLRVIDSSIDTPSLIDSSSMPNTLTETSNIQMAADAILERGKQAVNSAPKELIGDFKVVWSMLKEDIFGMGGKKAKSPEQMEKDAKKAANIQISISSAESEKARVEMQTQITSAKEEIRVLETPLTDEDKRTALHVSSGYDVKNLNANQIHEVRAFMIDQQEKAKKEQEGPIEAKGKGAGGMAKNQGRTDLKEGQSVTGSTTNGGQG